MSFYIGIQDSSLDGLISGGPEIPAACTRNTRKWVGTTYKYKQVPGKCIEVYPPPICFSSDIIEKNAAFFRRLKEDFGFCRLTLGMVGSNLTAAYKGGWTPDEITVWFDNFSKLNETKAWDKYQNGTYNFNEFLAAAISERIKYLSDLYINYQAENNIPDKDRVRIPFHAIYMDEIHEVFPFNPEVIGVDVSGFEGYKNGLAAIKALAQAIALLRNNDTTGLFRSVDENGNTIDRTQIIASTFSRTTGISFIDAFLEFVSYILKFLGFFWGHDEIGLAGLFKEILGLDEASIENMDFSMPIVGGAFDTILYSAYSGGDIAFESFTDLLNWQPSEDQRYLWTLLNAWSSDNAGGWISLYEDHTFTEDGLEYERLLGHATNLGWNEIFLYAQSRKSGNNWVSCEEFMDYLRDFAASAANAGWLEENAVDQHYEYVTEYCQSYPDCKNCEVWASTPPANWPSAPGGIKPVTIPRGITLGQWYYRHFTIGM